MKSGTKKLLIAVSQSMGAGQRAEVLRMRLLSISDIKQRGRANANALADATLNGWVVPGAPAGKNLVITPSGRDALAAAIANPSVFDDDSRPYGTTEQRGNPATWRGSFEDAQDLTQPQANTILNGRSPYAVLGVGRTASFDEIKTAFRKKANAAHPDKGGSDDAMRLVLAAWAVLKERHAVVEEEVETIPGKDISFVISTVVVVEAPIEPPTPVVAVEATTWTDDDILPD
jgi:hypothetical protein